MCCFVSEASVFAFERSEMASAMSSWRNLQVSFGMLLPFSECIVASDFLLNVA